MMDRQANLTPDENETHVSETTKTSRFGSKIKWIVGAVLVVLVLIYGIGVYHYKDHFQHNVSINGTKVNGMTVEEAENTFTEDFASHVITITEKEREETIAPEDVDAVISVGTQIEDLFDSFSPWTWFTNLFGTSDYTVELDVTYDEEKLNEVVNNLECFAEGNVIAPEDAYIQAGEAEFEIVPEVLGNTVKKKKLIKRIGTCLATCVTSINLEEEDLYKLPSYFESDEVVQKALKKANKFTQGTITYDFDYTTETVDYSLSKDWVKITDDFKVSLIEDKVGDYVDGLCKTYNTMGSSRSFTTSYGSTINIYGGDYGWKIYFDEEKAELIEDLKSGEDVTREPVYSYEAMCRNSATDDIGDSYVEVSISGQEVWLYVDGECLLDTSCVTGMKSSYDTDTGIYAITYKTSPATLTGLNSNGSSYSSDVTYWMPFNGNQGLHDATWRSSFGGSIYKSNGSHGCVNLPYSAAATIYKYVDAGFPVVIY